MGIRERKNGNVFKHVIIELPIEEHNALKSFVALRNVTIKQYVYEALQTKIAEDQIRQ